MKIEQAVIPHLSHSPQSLHFGMVHLTLFVSANA